MVGCYGCAVGRLISSREHRFNPRWLRRFPQVFHSAVIWNPAVGKGFCQGRGKSAFPLDAEAVRSGSFLVWLLRFDLVQTLLVLTLRAAHWTSIWGHVEHNGLWVGGVSVGGR